MLRLRRHLPSLAPVSKIAASEDAVIAAVRHEFCEQNAITGAMDP